MPVGTIDTSEHERIWLKTLEGAYIDVRPLPFGMKLTRREKATRMFMESDPSMNRAQRRAAKDSTKLEIEMLNKWSTMYDFAYCIVDHNITDSKERQLDFTKPMDFDNLHPKIGSEIERILDDLNNEEEDEDEELFTKSPSSSLEVQENSSSNEPELVQS